jgi:hypothetical protein
MDMTVRRLLKGSMIPIMVLALNLLMVSAVFSETADNAPRMTVQELKARMDRGEDVLIIDVRTGWEYTASKIRIKGAVRIPLSELENSRYKDLPQGKEIIIYCT